MSALNVILKAGVVHVITDTAGLDERGAMACETAKAIALPHMRMVLALRGKHGVLSLIADVLQRECEDLREAVTKGPALLRDGAGNAQIKATLAEHFDLVLAGFLGDGPAAYLMCSTNKHSGPLLAWQPFKIEGGTLMPPLPEDAQTPTMRADPMTAMPAILAAQRRQHLDAAGRGAIGGGIVRTSMGRDGAVAMKVLGEWMDMRGEPIDPAGELILAEIPTPVRAQPRGGVVAGAGFR